MNTLRRGLVAAAMLSAAVPSLSWAEAAQWPSKPIRIVVAYPGGGVSDVVARALGEKLSVQLATPIVVENKAGAGGAIGLDAVAKSVPDGYTIGFSAISPVALNPHLGAVPFDPQKDLAPVVSVMYSPVLILATTAERSKTFKELLEEAQRSPGTVRWATAGLASLGHIVLEQIKYKGNVDITHIPYKGGGQQLNDALGAQYEVLSTNAGPTVMQHIQAGKFKPLAVGAPQRLESLPNVPTLAELGFAEANSTSLFGIFAPAKTPKAVLQRLNHEFNKALAMPDIQEKLKKSDNVPTGGDAQSFAHQIVQESANNARIIKAANLSTK
ncbi:Bug family tripartite tricarboxylate transporter substrate binding protein [Comamonas sp. NoAH]|uniref:Bug family tripartite tricarboxylate transporter substrate binding protein n=1 Tax=Comamonas halotolerans TaxID=3041496 RepID=UPI0024E0CC10|nr:tripartite tricarboxylate transporter substrate binding protein [Comamonas sp. NoAH]